MGKASGQTVRGYHPRIFAMHATMQRREQIREEEQRMMNKKKLRAAYWMQRLSNAMQVLKTADPQGWERWFDNDSNVPAEATDRQIVELVEARVRELTGSYPIIKAQICRDIFIWQDELGVFVFTKEVGKKTLYVFEFVSIETAQDFIKGLPYKNCGYGNVLDLLPAPAAFTSVESE